MRTLDDILLSSDERDSYNEFLKAYFDEGQLGSLGFDDRMLGERSDISFREVCNKIIHAEDIRPTYCNGSNPRDEDYTWGMTGLIELRGKLGKRSWDVWLQAEEFLSVSLEVLDYLDSMQQNSVYDSAAE